MHGIETYYCPNCKCECPSIPRLAALVELWQQDKTQKHFYFHDERWNTSSASLLKACDCPFPGKPHSEGARDCVLCECINCQLNETRSIHDLLPCVGTTEDL